MEAQGFFRLADRTTDLFTQCDNILQTRDNLERLRLLAGETLKEDKKV
jgi:hypothetical protein